MKAILKKLKEQLDLEIHVLPSTGRLERLRKSLDGYYRGLAQQAVDALIEKGLDNPHQCMNELLGAEALCRMYDLPRSPGFMTLKTKFLTLPRQSLNIAQFEQFAELVTRVAASMDHNFKRPYVLCSAASIFFCCNIRKELLRYIMEYYKHPFILELAWMYPLIKVMPKKKKEALMGLSMMMWVHADEFIDIALRAIFVKGYDDIPYDETLETWDFDALPFPTWEIGLPSYYAIE